MLQPNRKTTMPAIDLYDPSPDRVYPNRLRLPLVGALLAVLALAMATLAAAGPALAYSDAPVDASGGSGAEAAHPSATAAGDDGQPPAAAGDFLN